MLYKFTVKTNSPSFVDITARLENIVAKSAVSNGLCVVTLANPSAAVAFVEGANERAKADILSELNIALPPRMDYPSGGDPYICTGRTKAALLVGSKAIAVIDGKSQLAEGRSICVVDFIGTQTIEVSIKCL